MSEYTKEQEAEALAWVEKGVFCKPDLNIVIAMAKRTAEAERERDALKARVAELERIATDYREERDIAERKLSAPKGPPAQPVIVTRELLEMMLADAETRAVYGYGRGDVPLNPAARLVVALRKMLEAKP